jgi:hypothetical protein
LLWDIDVFEVSHGIVSHVAEEPAVDILWMCIANLKSTSKPIEVRNRIAAAFYGFRLFLSVGILDRHLLSINLEGSDWLTAYKGEAVLVAMVVGTFQQEAARVHIAQLQVNIDRRKSICQEFF